MGLWDSVTADPPSITVKPPFVDAEKITHAQLWSLYYSKLSVQCSRHCHYVKSNRHRYWGTFSNRFKQDYHGVFIIKCTLCTVQSIVHCTLYSL